MSVLIGTTKKGVPKNALARARRIFSVGIRSLGGIMSLGLGNAMCPYLIFKRIVTTRGDNDVVGISSVTSCRTVAHMPNCSVTGDTMRGFAH